MKIKQYQLPGLVESGEIELSPAVFDVPYNRGLVWQAVNAYLAGKRSGSKANLSRSEVRGGGIKPWRQKGLGRARAGSNTSPIWRTGGVTFAAKPRSYIQKLPKKMYRAAMRSLFADLLRQGTLSVIKDLPIKDHKTKSALATLGELSNFKLLILTDFVSEEAHLSMRNLPRVTLMSIRKVNPFDLSRADRILMTPESIKFCEEWLS
ncbi:MAG: 50S ribosomal protein L4 [Legionellales bacterium]|nr:50S ribosomal protein L4 [Legionellales bacterium]|tara:strand:+ start:1117 stop:1737 length:621 start_codon:yes stop_codon:yes gene_type:complete